MITMLKALASIVLASAGYQIVPELLNSYSGNVKSKLTKIGREIYSKMSNNQKYLDKLYDAFQNNRGSLQSLLYTGTGFGPRIEAIYSAIKDLTNKYEKDKTEATKDQAELTNDYNEVNNALANAGSGLVPAIQADQVASKMEQYIQGGLDNAKI